MFEAVSLRAINRFFTVGNERTLRAKKNISVSFISKATSMIISFLIVPLTLGYVGKVEYGIWMTIASIIQWISYFDIGLGNGLRNKLAEALALNDHETAKIYISSSFAVITLIAIVIYILFFIAGYFISWNAVLNTDIVSNEDLFKTVFMVFTFFCIGFVMNIVSSILQAMQRYAVNDILGLIAQLLGLIALFTLVKTTKGSLFLLCLVYSSKTAVVMLIATVFLFFNSLKNYRPSLKYVQLKKTAPLFNLGLKFFLNQILYLIIAEAPVILVVQFFGPADVTIYNLAFRYVTITSVGYIMILTPFLSAFTEAYTKKEFEWIKKIIKKINIIWMISSVATILMIFGSKIFFHLWIGDSITIPIVLVITLGISSIITNWNGTFGLFLNGVGKVNLQLYILIVQALLFFPLSYLFYVTGMGLISIVLTQIIFSLISAVFVTIQYKKILNQTATGVWNR